MQVRRALLSVYDKTGLVPFAQGLQALGAEIIATGNTLRMLQEAGVQAAAVSDITGFPEILDGRVKSLHPHIHGGILARRHVAGDLADIEAHGIGPIDLVAGNLYPFREATAGDGFVDGPARPASDGAIEEAVRRTIENAMEHVDIGGPAMLRAAAKNHRNVLVVVDPARYEQVLQALRDGTVTDALRLELAYEAFAHTAAYDAVIARFLRRLGGAPVFPARLVLAFERAQELRYGENPHQKAAVYRSDPPVPGGIMDACQLQGKELSFNNLQDADAAVSLVREFTEPAVVAVKHGNPCGVGVASELADACRKAYEADPKSIFGGIVACNRQMDGETASILKDVFLEIIAAPGFDDEARAVFAAKRNLRLLAVPEKGRPGDELELRHLKGGLLAQEPDTLPLEDEEWRTVSQREPTPEELEDLRFAWRVVKHVRSNSIVVAKGGKTLGIGSGQVNRIDAARHALERAGEAAEGAVLASEALLPFGDVIAAAAEAGIRAVVQPGGSIRDQESIDGADRAGMALIFTGVRHFRH